MQNNCNQQIVMAVAIIGLAILCWDSRGSNADDWPQWRGPRRDGVSSEIGLMQSWPAGGPKVAWQAVGLGTGYSSVIVGQGRLFTMGRKESDVVMFALDEATGKTVWMRKIGETSRHPCSTPTLDGDLLYALDPDGDLVCLEAATGEVVWQISFIEKFSGRMMSGRGYGESPLVDGQRLICTPGGPDAAIVAIDKLTGSVIWKAAIPELGSRGKDGAGFSSIVITEAAGLRQYVQLVGRDVVGIDARNGRFLWGFNPIANETANIPTPVVHNEFIFAANGYTAGSVLLKLVADNGLNGADQGVKAEIVYTLSGNQFQNHHGGFVRLGDFLFSGHGNNNGLPTCLEFRSGRVIWKRRGPGVGSASVVAADGRLVTITDSLLSPEGTMSQELVGRLLELQNPMIVSLAGTHVSDVAILQLQPLGIVGLNLELCNHITDVGLKHTRTVVESNHAQPNRCKAYRCRVGTIARPQETEDFASGKNADQQGRHSRVS